MLAHAFFLSLGDFFKQLAVHARLFWVHLTAELKLSFNLDVTGSLGSGSTVLHLLDKEVLGRFDLVGSLFLLKLALSVNNLGL